MDYVVLFEDNNEKAGKRAEFMAAHLAFLSAHAEKIAAAGPVTDARTGSPAGGLWLVSTGTREDVEALVRADPFWPTGLRKSYRILEWTKVRGARSEL